MSTILDVILIGGGAYYIGKRLGDRQDDNFKRILIGTAVGVPAALKGPEIYDALTAKVDEGGDDFQNKVLASLAGGAAAYLAADYYGKTNAGNSQQSPQTKQGQQGGGKIYIP